MAQRMPDPGFEAEHQTHLAVAVRALARLQQAVPADTAAAQYCRVALASLGHLEVAMQRENLIPPPARGREDRHIL